MTTTGRRLRSLALAVVLAAAPAAGLVGCGENPATGRRQLALVPEAQEIEIGRDASRAVAESLGLVRDPALQEYVQSLGARLAAASERPHLPWTFRVVDDPTPNAFALPGGYVFVTRGLLTLLTSEAELASVLGHEIGHVTARHSVNQISKAQLAELGLGLGVRWFPNLERLAGVASVGLELAFLKYGRDAERQADALGFRYAVGQQYDPREMADVFVALQRENARAGRGTLPNWLASHPAEPERIAAVQRRIADLPPATTATRVGRDAYLDRIDGLAYGEDPRNGYFSNGEFLHPALAFRVRMPRGWATQNLSSAVLAVDPRREAMVQLTHAGDLSPEDAARRTFAREGVRAEVAAQRVNGVDAVVAQFVAVVEGGTVRGTAAFYAHGDATLQLVGYAPEAAYARHAAAFRGVIDSFAPLVDARLLDVRPAAVDVVRLAGPTSLADFARGRPGAVPLDELALLNHVADPGAALPAGMRIKHVVGSAARR